MPTKRNVLDRLYAARRAIDALSADELLAVRASHPLLKERLSTVRTDIAVAIMDLEAPRRGG